MERILVNLSIIGIVATIAIGGTIAYFSDVETSTGNTLSAGTLDLKIRDQNHSYGDGVTATWVASDMKPGDEYKFDIPFVGLYNSGTIAGDHLEITCDYAVEEESPCIESDTDCQTNLHPDEMAKEMVITRCVYRDDVWCIDCLTGKKYDKYDVMTHQCSGNLLAQNDDWEIEDQNGDDKRSFYELKNDKLDNLPPANSETKYEMDVKFDEDAGNDFQGDTFDLTMIFTLNQDASQ